MVHRIREAMAKGGLVSSETVSETGYRIEPAMDDPDERIVVKWHDPGLDTEDLLGRARQRDALQRILWLVVDEVEDLSGVHLQGWGDPFVVLNYGNLDPADN